MPEQVLVVDRHPDVCDFVRASLESSGDYRIIAALDEDAALYLLDREPPDLVLLDPMLPDPENTKLVARVAERDIPMLLMTGAPPVMERLAEMGWPHLRKLLDPAELRREMRRARAQLTETAMAGLAWSQIARLARAEAKEMRGRSVALRERSERRVELSRASPPECANRGPALGAEALPVLYAAEAWGRALEAVKEADEERRFEGLEQGELEDAESALYVALLKWRLTRGAARNDGSC